MLLSSEVAPGRLQVWSAASRPWLQPGVCVGGAKPAAAGKGSRALYILGTLQWWQIRGWGHI